MNNKIKILYNIHNDIYFYVYVMYDRVQKNLHQQHKMIQFLLLNKPHPHHPWVCTKLPRSNFLKTS